MPSELRRTKAAYVIANPKAKLLDQMREVLRVKHYALRTEQSYCDWVVRFLKFHRDRAGGWKHPREMGGVETGLFLTHLAAEQGVAAATQNQALNALAFLYQEVLHEDGVPAKGRRVLADGLVPFATEAQGRRGEGGERLRDS